MNVDDEEGENYVSLGSPYDPDNHEGVFKSGVKVKTLIMCNGIWFTSSGFGIMWNATQVRIKEPERLENYSFLDDTDDEESKDEESQDEVIVQTPSPIVEKEPINYVDSSSDDDVN